MARVMGFPGNPSSRRKEEAFDEEEARREALDRYGGELEEDEEEPEEPRRRFRVLPFLLLLVVLAFVGFLVYQGMEDRHFSEAEISAVTPIHLPENASRFALGETIVSYSRDGVGCIDLNGNALWSQSFEMRSPMVSVNGDRAAFADEGGSEIYLVSPEGPITTIPTNMPIRQIAVSSAGHVAAVLEDLRLTWIYLYDKDGSEVAVIRRSMEQSGYPLAIALSPDGKLLACAQLCVENTEFKTELAFYNFGAVGQSAVENYVSGNIYTSEIFPFLGFMGRSHMVAVSNARAAFFEGADKPKSSSDNFFASDLQGVYMGENYCGLLFPDSAGEELYRLQIWSAAGTMVGELPFSLEFTDIKFFGERVMITDGQQLILASPDGEIRFSGNLGRSAELVLPTSRNGRFRLVCTDGIVTVDLH